VTRDDPYTPPKASGEGASGGPSFLRGNPLWLPAIVLLLQSLITFAVCLQVVAVLVELSWRRPEDSDFVPLAIFAASLIGQVAVIVGSVSALRMKCYSAAWWGAVVACIPLLTPCCVFGIPFGMWIILELRREDVQRKFAERKGDAG